MDPIAHTLVGATLAETGLKRKTALATAALIIGANLPDVDAVTMLGDGDYSLWIRRGWSHGLPALLIWPFLLAGLLILFDRLRRSPVAASIPGNSGGRWEPVRAAPLLLVSFIGVWSHPFLDWLNTYGIRLLMPLDGAWFYGDTLFIVDPWMWLLMAAPVVMARSGSLPSAVAWIVIGLASTRLIFTTPMLPVSARFVWVIGVLIILLIRTSGSIPFLHRSGLLRELRFNTGRAARVSLLLLGVYLIFMWTGSRWTSMLVRTELLAQGVDTKEVFANPLPARIGWRSGLAVSESHYWPYRMNWLGSEFQLADEPIPRTEPDAIVRVALASPEIRGFVNWMRYPAWQVEPVDEGWRVIIRDLRYADWDRPAESGFGSVIVVVHRSEVEQHFNQARGGLIRRGAER